MSATVQTPPAVFDVDTGSFETRVIQASHRTPVLVDFWAAWCGPCKALAPVLEKLAGEAQGAFVLAKVDTDANQDLAASMGVRSLPTVRLFVDGAPVAEFMGAQPESSVRAFLEQHLPHPVDSTAAENIDTLLEAGELDAARAALDALDTATRESPVMGSLEARLWILQHAAALVADRDSGQAEGSGDLHTRFVAALQLAASKDYEEALDGLLGIVSRNKAFAEGAAREAMLKIFEALGSDDPRVGAYRSRLASALN